MCHACYATRNGIRRLVCQTIMVSVLHPARDYNADIVIQFPKQGYRGGILFWRAVLVIAEGWL